MKVSFDIKSFERKLFNVTEYSMGFLDGVHGGKLLFLKNFGDGVIKVLQMYIDSEARTNPQSLHHVYEWYKTGSPSARLFDIHQSVNRGGVSFYATFTQSQTLSYESNEPFLDKARVMEKGKTLRIRPKNATVLSFNIDGEQIFTKKEVTVDNPGGDYVEGSFKDVMDEFFSSYFTQSFLRSSGLYDYLQTPSAYKHNLPAGSIKGRIAGYETGFRWITGAKVGVE
jgi:hypothetical protein